MSAPDKARTSKNFYQLGKGEEVIVVGKDFSWYKVQIPPGTYVYISDKYVRLVSSTPGALPRREPLACGRRERSSVTA